MDWALGTQQALPHMTLLRAQQDESHYYMSSFYARGQWRLKEALSSYHNETWGQVPGTCDSKAPSLRWPF